MSSLDMRLRGAGDSPARPMLRAALIALTAFLTLVDLFAMQAVLPTLIARYGVGASAMGTAVNASTIGMAVASLATSYLGARIDRRTGITVSLALLALPTACLAVAPDLVTFTALRICQGVFMASAFTLTLAYLGEHVCGAEGASTFAAYIAGNVASNFVGRLMSAALADHFGLTITFFVFALLNIAGAVLVHVTASKTQPMAVDTRPAASPASAIGMHVADGRLRATFAIGFLILFTFIGAFTYVNLVLVTSPIGLSAMSLGFVYFVFAPSIATTLWAGTLAQRFGARRGLWLYLGVAAAGLPLMLAGSLAPVMIGLTLFAIGTFAAQAVATSHVGRIAVKERGAASGLYLASYFAGGLTGSAVLGQVFERFGWTATVIAIGVALALAAALATRIEGRAPSDAR